MGERRTKMVPVRVEKLCDTEGCDGVMVPDGTVLTSMPPGYPHSCPKCKRREVYAQVSGHVVYEEAPDAD